MLGDENYDSSLRLPQPILRAIDTEKSPLSHSNRGNNTVHGDLVHVKEQITSESHL